MPSSCGDNDRRRSVRRWPRRLLCADPPRSVAPWRRRYRDDAASSRRISHSPPPTALKRAGPSTPKPHYDDSPVDRFFLKLFNARLAAELGDDVRGRGAVTGDYDDVVARCVRLVSEAPNAAEAKARGGRVLRSLLPPGTAPALRFAFGLFPGWFVARHAAAVTPYLLPWLVGRGRVIDAPEDLMVDDASSPPGNAFEALKRMNGERADDRKNRRNQKNQNVPPGYKQGVLLERCRVLEESGCAGVCLNVCKLPTQQFLGEELGLPVTLAPDYETFECRFLFGKTPPPPESDPAFDTPCFGQCPVARVAGDAPSCDRLSPFESDAVGGGGD